MPYLKIKTSKPVTDATRQTLLKKASQLVARELSKPEQYMMVSLEPASPMIFAGSLEPAVHLDLRAIGLPTAKTGDLARLLCELVEAELGIGKDRVFINFTDFPGDHWGWNGDTL